jgi:biotin operon repressor
VSRSVPVLSPSIDRPFLTVEEAAAVLGISRTLAYSLAPQVPDDPLGSPMPPPRQSTHRRSSRRLGALDERRRCDPERRCVTRPKPRTDRHSVVIGPDTADVIRAVGATAWIVLIHLYGSPPAVSRSVTASTRTLAAALGLSKDTCARALRTLRSAGLIEVDTTRTENGRFGTIRYRLLAPPKLIRTQTNQVHDVEPPEPTAPPTPRPQATGPSEQLTLLAFE